MVKLEIIIFPNIFFVDMMDVSSLLWGKKIGASQFCVSPIIKYLRGNIVAEFLDIIIQFPTVVFTVLLGVVIMYWMLVIMGVFDMDVLDFDFDLDVDADVDLDVDAGTDVGDADAHHSGISGIFAFFGLVGAPVTVITSFIVIWCWMLCLLYATYIVPIIPDLGFTWAISIVAMFVAFIASLYLTQFSIKPIQPLFEHEGKALGNKDIVGQLCEIITGKVDEKFGQARYNKDGAGLVIEVRNTSGATLKKGNKALIVGYSAEKMTYRVEPYESDGFEIEVKH